MPTPKVPLILTAIVALLCAQPTNAQHTRQSLLAPTANDCGLCRCVSQAVVVQHYPSGNDINFEETYLFDNQGDLTEYRKRGFGGERVTTYPLASVGSQTECRFDYDGDLLERLDYDMQGRLHSTTHYIYAEGGNLVESIVYTYHSDSGMVKSREVTTYDKKEHPVRQQLFSADELLQMETTMRYDRHGNLTRRIQLFYDDDATERHEERRRYSYDKHGNWVQCQVFYDGKERYTIERILTYR